MKRGIIYIVLLALVFAAPVKRADVGKLQPVEVVGLSIKDEAVCLQTDTGDSGKGATALEALNDMKETADGIVYLDTAQFLLMEEEAAQYADALRDHLKPSVKVCFISGKTDLKAAAKYLSVHHDLPKIKHWNVGDPLPVMTNEKIIEKSQK